MTIAVVYISLRYRPRMTTCRHSDDQRDEQWTDRRFRHLKPRFRFSSGLVQASDKVLSPQMCVSLEHTQLLVTRNRGHLCYVEALFK